MHNVSGGHRGVALIASLFCLMLIGVGPAQAEAPAESDALEVGGLRVVVAPLNIGITAVDEVSSGIAPVTQELLLHLKESGHRVAALEREGATQLWQEVLIEARHEDPEISVYEVYARFANRVGEQVEYGVMVFPSLVVRAARVRGELASWDGVDRWVSVPRLDDQIDTVRDGALQIYSHGGTGELAAASLHVAIFEPGGDMRFEGAGGLSLLHDVKRAEGDGSSAFEMARRENPFDDSGELREGISTAFSRHLPSSPAASAN